MARPNSFCMPMSLFCAWRIASACSSRIAEYGCARLDLLGQPVQVRFVVREGDDEVPARHVRLVDADVHDDPLVIADVFDHAPQVAHEPLHQTGDQLELHEGLGHVLARLLGACVILAVLGIGLLGLVVQGRQCLEPLGRQFGIRSLVHLVGAVVVAVVVVIRGILLFLQAGLGEGGDLIGHLGVGVRVDEAGDHVGQADLAVLEALVLAQDFGDGLGVVAQGGEHLRLAVLDALGDQDLALAGEQFHGPHLAHVHTHRVGGPAELAVDTCQGRRRFFSHVVIGRHGGVGDAHQQGIHVRRDLMDSDAHVIDHGDDVLDLLRVDDLFRQMVIDLGIGQVALLLALGDQ